MIYCWIYGSELSVCPITWVLLKAKQNWLCCFFVVFFFFCEDHTVLESHSKDLASQNASLMSFMMFSFWESLIALLLARIVCISVDGSSVFAAADFRLLNVANLLCSSEQFFAVRDDEIKDCLRVKAEQERLAVIQVELLSNMLWCWSGPLIPVESHQFVTVPSAAKASVSPCRPYCA